MSPVICFGQQPCGFFPAGSSSPRSGRRGGLQAELGGEIVFFCHDSDHDPRETQTILRHRRTGAPLHAQFRLREQAAAQVLAALPQARARRLARPHRAASCRPSWTRRGSRPSAQIRAATVADFCLEMYRRMGLLDGIRVVRSGDPAVRRAACDVADFFVDVPYEGEIVRARCGRRRTAGCTKAAMPSSTCRSTDSPRNRSAPPATTRLRWMQSVMHCTHYVAGRGRTGVSCIPRRRPEITFLSPATRSTAPMKPYSP